MRIRIRKDSCSSNIEHDAAQNWFHIKAGNLTEEVATNYEVSPYD